MPFGTRQLIARVPSLIHIPSLSGDTVAERLHYRATICCLVGWNSPDGGDNLENPNSKFPKPPFKRQTQPWPGLAGKWSPALIMAKKAIEAAAGLLGARR